MKLRTLAVVILCCVVMGTFSQIADVSALGSQQNPQSGSLGLEATVPGSPPTQPATIAIPSNGQTFTSTPITISGLCKTGLLVKLFTNNVFIGSAVCANNSYSLKTDLFAGRNDVVAKVFDALDQQGPDSNLITVTFTDAQYAQFGTHVALSSDFARKGADPNVSLGLPFIVTGGRAPYALSIDWGDGSGTDLKTVAFAGTSEVSHAYTQAGVYNVIAKVTDTNGTSAYLQVVGVANGKITGALNNPVQGGTITRNVVLWQPLIILVPLLIIAFWLGQRYELFTIRRTIEQSRDR